LGEEITKTPKTVTVIMQHWPNIIQNQRLSLNWCEYSFASIDLSRCRFGYSTTYWSETIPVYPTLSSIVSY